MLRTPEVKQRLAGYLDQISKPLITSVVTGLSELYANGHMAGNLVNDVFFNLDRAVDLIDQINTMEPMLPSDNTLPSILHSHSAKSLSDLQTFGDLKAVEPHGHHHLPGRAGAPARHNRCLIRFPRSIVPAMLLLHSSPLQYPKLLES